MYKQTNTQLAVANAVGDECITLCTALFEKSTKKRDYQGIAKIANRMEPAQKLALLVHKETDIWYLSQELQEYINPSNLLFTLTQEPGVYYDSKGRLVSDFS